MTNAHMIYKYVDWYLQKKKANFYRCIVNAKNAM